MPKEWRHWAIWGVLLFFALAAISGVIENRSDAGFMRLWPSLGRFATGSLNLAVWKMALVFMLLLAAQSVFFLVFRAAVRKEFATRIATIQAAQDEMDALGTAILLVQMDDTLLRLLPRLASAPSRGEAMHLLLTEFLRDATGVFGGEVSRGMILHIEGDHLVPWVGYQMPQETLERTRFRLTARGNKAQGVAKRTFQDGKLRVVRFSREKGKWKPNNRDYVVFDHNRPHPAYRSFVTVAIVGDSTGTLGVLCFDSMNKDAFDLPEIQRFLSSIARRIASAISIYRQLERGPHGPE